MKKINKGSTHVLGQQTKKKQKAKHASQHCIYFERERHDFSDANGAQMPKIPAGDALKIAGQVGYLVPNAPIRGCRVFEPGKPTATRPFYLNSAVGRECKKL